MTHVIVKMWIRGLTKMMGAAFLLLTSLYCLLAFLPYTYYALIKAPAYEWMPWFVRHHSQIYWLLLAAIAVAYSPARKSLWYVTSLAVLSVIGISITARPFMTVLESDFQAYFWGTGVLVPLLFLAAVELKSAWRRLTCPRPLSYLPAICSAMAVASLSLFAVKLRIFSIANSAETKMAKLEIDFWVVITHTVLALLAVSVLNIIFMMAAKSRNPRVFSYGILLLALFIALAVAFVRFLDSALNFSGWPARLYAALFSAAMVLCGFVLAASSQRTVRLLWKHARKTSLSKILTLPVLAAVAGTAVFLIPWIAEWDWNGLFQRILTAAIWLAFSSCFYFLWPRSRTHSVQATLAVLIVTISSYKGLQATEIFWAKPLGKTDDEIGSRLEQYASLNASFELAHHLLGNAPEAAECGELCRILRQYTNVRDADTTAQVKLTDSLVPAAGERPNIFVIVVDSLRPDYLGAYNRKVDFTPNIDAFAKDSSVFRNAYTQYAGTTLSEPAIWSGALLLHAHYLRPFQNVNSLEKLINVDGYRMIASFDTVLQEILSPADNVTKLDTGKPWNQFEFCNTVDQLDHSLDRAEQGDRPIFFYAQPMNVHQFARNQQPTWRDTDWSRPGFSRKAALEVHQVDECMGNFVSMLKRRGLYENSIVILTADHGDALGELKRLSHSYLIYPEIMRVPLIVHLPRTMRNRFVYDENAMSSLIDVTPSLYYLLGHKPIHSNSIYGHSLFAGNRNELESHRRHELFLASDEAAVYGLLDENGRYLYTTYDSPARSFLFDLERDPNAEHSVLTGEAKKRYDQRIIDYLHLIADFYGYKPGIRSLLASTH